MGNWLGNCSDPEVLFEEAVAKSDQIIGFVRYQTFHDSEQKDGRDILTGSHPVWPRDSFGPTLTLARKYFGPETTSAW